MINTFKSYIRENIDYSEIDPFNKEKWDSKEYNLDRIDIDIIAFNLNT